MWAYIYVIGSVVVVALLMSYVIWSIKSEDYRGL